MLLPSAHVIAQDSDPVPLEQAARTSFEAGRSAYDEGNYTAALQAFQSGYELSPRAPFLFNIASCYDRLHRGEEALAHYEQYLEEVPDADNRDYVNSRIVTIRSQLSQSSSETEPEPEEDSDSPFRTPAWIAFGASGIGAITFAVAGGLALSTHNALAECRQDETCEEGLADRGRRRSIIADIGAGTALAGLATGIVLWILSRKARSDERRDSLRTAIVPSYNGGTLQIQGSF